jgi:chromosome segregation protein
MASTPETSSQVPTRAASAAPARVSAGAVWRLVDLHLHSPGVQSFSCPDGADVRSASGRLAVAQRYAGQLEKQEISVCAVTDYNGIRAEWFEPIREESRKRGITVFPGAELSFRVGRHGLHILVVFDTDADVEEINRFIHALDRDPATPLFRQDRSHRDIDPEHNVPDAINGLRARFGCLVIAPHPDQENGICRSLQAADAAKLLLDIEVDAIEHCPESEIRKLQSTQVLSARFFENVARVEFSDPKRIEEIGTKSSQDGTRRATFLKLSATDLSALRLALHDPGTRLVLHRVPEAKHSRIRRIEVSGSGFLGNLVVEWNDDLNVIIGGRGAGKSAVLESLRYGLGLEPYSEQSYRGELVKHALGSGGRIAITVERPIGDGKTKAYRVVRVLGEDPRVYDLDPENVISVNPTDLFGPAGAPAILGQREIYAVSGSEEYRIRLLDDLVGEEARQRAAAVRDSVEALRSNARSILEAKSTLAKREEYRQRLKTIEHEISVFEKHGTADKLRKATTLKADQQHLKGTVGALEKARRTWAEGRESITGPLSSAARDLAKGQSSEKALLEEAALALEALERGLRDLNARGDALFKETSERLQDIWKRWVKALGPLEEELNRIKQEAHTDDLDPDRLLRWTEERAGLGPLIEELDRVESELQTLIQKRVTLLQTVQDRRLEEHTLRREKAGAIGESVGGRLRLKVEFKGQKEEYRQHLVSLLKGSGLSADAVQKLSAPEATDGAALAKAVRGGVADVQHRFEITSGMADRLVRWLAGDEAHLFELETLIPSDALQVELQDQAGYRPLERLSVGQRATAILLLLFALEGRVLILDQPEDDLDNRFIYEDIVTILREQKGLIDVRRRRQIVAATHNANIPVIGDAELVLALEAREDRAYVTARSSIDDSHTRELIKAIMEGGEEAFRRRAEKYGGI